MDSFNENNLSLNNNYINCDIRIKFTVCLFLELVNYVSNTNHTVFAFPFPQNPSNDESSD